MRDGLAQLLHALLVRRDLRLHVVDVLQRVAGGVFRAGEEVIERALAEAAAIHQLEVVDIDAFLLDRDCVRRHRAGRNAAYVGVVAARGDPEQKLAAGLVEHRRADGDVGEMRAAVVGRVDGIDVARRDPALVLANDGFDRAIHGAEMHRHVRRVGDQRAVGVEHGAGEIEPLLDVDGVGGVLQGHAHLLRDRHEEVIEHFEHDRVGVGADRALALEADGALEHQVVLGGDAGAPAVLDHDGLMRLDDDGRPGHGVAGRKLGARIDRGVVPLAARIESRAARRGRKRVAGDRQHRLGELRAAADGLDRHRFHHQVLGLVDESEPRFVGRLEGGLHSPAIAAYRLPSAAACSGR